MSVSSILVWAGGFLIGYLLGLTKIRALNYLLMVMPFFAVMTLDVFYYDWFGASEEQKMIPVLYLTFALPVACLAWLGFSLSCKSDEQ